MSQFHNILRVTSGWVGVAGVCTAFAATIDPTALIFLVLFIFAIPAMRWRFGMKLGGIFLYLLGAAGPLILHAAMVMPITGDMFPPQFHREMAVTHVVTASTHAPRLPSMTLTSPRPRDGGTALGVDLAHRLGVFRRARNLQPFSRDAPWHFRRRRGDAPPLAADNQDTGDRDARRCAHRASSCAA